jgi:hypothetical protein
MRSHLSSHEVCPLAIQVPVVAEHVVDGEAPLRAKVAWGF